MKKVLAAIALGQGLENGGAQASDDVVVLHGQHAARPAGGGHEHHFDHDGCCHQDRVQLIRLAKAERKKACPKGVPFFVLCFAGMKKSRTFAVGRNGARGWALL